MSDIQSQGFASCAPIEAVSAERWAAALDRLARKLGDHAAARNGAPSRPLGPDAVVDLIFELLADLPPSGPGRGSWGED